MKEKNLKFDGKGDYLEISDDEDFNLDGDFCIEGFFCTKDGEIVNIDFSSWQPKPRPWWRRIIDRIKNKLGIGWYHYRLGSGEPLPSFNFKYDPKLGKLEIEKNETERKDEGSNDS